MASVRESGPDGVEVCAGIELDGTAGAGGEEGDFLATSQGCHPAALLSIAIIGTRAEPPLGGTGYPSANWLLAGENFPCECSQDWTLPVSSGFKSVHVSGHPIRISQAFGVSFTRYTRANCSLKFPS